MNKFRTLIPAVAGLVALAATAAATAAPNGPYSARLAGFVATTVPFKPEDGMVFVLKQNKSGVGLALALESKHKGFVEIDDDATDAAMTLRFADASGQAIPAGGRQLEAWPFFEFSKDRRQALVELKMEDPLPDNASWILIDGHVAAKVASKTEVFASGLVEVKQGQSFSLNGIPMSIKVGSTGMGDANFPHEISIRTDERFKAAKSVAFIGPDGQEIPYSQGATMTMNGPGLSIMEIGYRFATEVPKVEVRATMWTDMEPVEVPVSVRVVNPL